MSLFRNAHPLVLRASTVATAVALSACSTDTLNVTNPDVIGVGSATSASGAVALRNGAIQDFAIVFSGTQDGVIVSTGNLADEIMATDTFFDRLLPNERSMNNNLGGAADALYLNMHLARAGAGSAIAAWAKARPASKDTLGELYAVRGYMEDFFAETYCSGVPFSSEDNAGGIIYGQPQTTQQILQRSAASFDTALINATSASNRNLAAVGKARALLNLGQYSAAAAAVAGVPTTFKYVANHSSATTRQYNGVWNGTVVPSSRYTVSNNEGTNGYNYLQTPADPRMPWATSTRVGFDGTTRNMPTQLKHPANNSPATVADGIEARLIELEARLQGGQQADRDAVFAGLNSLRATAITPAIAAIAGGAPTTQAAAVDQLFRERAYWTWLTGHRLGDMRRLVRQYGRDQSTVFPVGPVSTRFGSTYGSDVNFPVPFDESNNPNFKGCIDRKA
jgi:hypothetical protein